MLGAVRTHAQSWLIKAVLWAVVLAFVLTIFYSWGMGGARKERAVVATVDGDIITLREFRKAYMKMLDFYRKQTPDALGDKVVKGIKQTALDTLVRRKLIVEKAKKEGLLVTDWEVRETIRAIPGFRVNGQFKEDIYRGFLNNNGMLPRDFEETTRADLLVNKMERLIKGVERVPGREIKTLVDNMEKKVDVKYLVLTGKQFEDRVEAKEGDIRAYFKAHKEDFRAPEQRSAEYVFASAEDFEKKARAAQDEIEDYYYDHIKDFQTPKEVRARHILIGIAGKGKASSGKKAMEKARKRAESILKQLKQGADFAETARKFSEDPGSAPKGGDLGFFKRGMMVKPFEDAAFRLKKGETSGLVASPFGYHIIRVEDIHEEKTETPEEAGTKIIAVLKKNKGMRRAKRRLDKIIKDQGGKAGALEAVAGAFRADIRKTGLFSRMDDKLGTMEKPAEVIGEVFSLGKDEVGRPIRVRGGYYVPRLEKVIDSSIPTYEQVKKAVREAYQEETADKLCGEEVSRLQDKLAGGGSLKEIGRAFKVRVSNSGPLNKSSMAAKFRFSQDDINRLFEKNIGDTGSIKAMDKHYLYSVAGIKKPGEAEFAKAREKYGRFLLRGKQDAIFTAWVEDLKNQARIKINKSLVE